MFRRDGGQGPEQGEQLGPGSYTEGRRGYALCEGGGGGGAGSCTGTTGTTPVNRQT